MEKSIIFLCFATFAALVMMAAGIIAEDRDIFSASFMAAVLIFSINLILINFKNGKKN